MELTLEQMQHLFEQGYVLIPGVIPRERVNAALRAINHSLGEGIDPARLTTFRAQSYAPELQRDPVITDLYNATPVKELAESLIGEGMVRPIGGAVPDCAGAIARATQTASRRHVYPDEWRAARAHRQLYDADRRGAQRCE